ncbi:Lrp/AsnC family transcriptional regulator [Mycolicibacterium komossense]|uniref:Lrp/AsnC family transcriptional regulator n=1 Tax=Mycolicibacterium komossense TaxID=1779 RepID=A0ABT3C984_9MYCO|nr:Lrp/AsnC family transcriptional regulator [Mycolicibacterium komossense]MCV7226032.1 Lrp/AsnC family transcriptional regulator [Mycolicibacterium komossense]
MIAPLDGKILHALQLSPRVSFRRIGEVIGAPEQTVARRYRKLRHDGAVRVIGVVNPQIFGEAQWVVRVHAKPDDLPRLSEALVRRREVTHANVLSGWTELVCVIRAPLGDSADGLLQRLPRTSAVLSLDIDLVLHEFGDATGAAWTAYGHTLTAEEARQLVPPPASAPPSGPVAPREEDLPLIEALAEDGRAPHARLAEHIGWSSARVKRRLAALEASATLTYDVDVLPDRLGFGVNAMLWLTTAPSHLAEVAEQIAAHPEIASVSAISGRNNLMAIAICRDVEHLYSYLTRQLAAIDRVQGYDISIRTQRLKQAGSLVTGGRLVSVRRS